MIWLSWRQFRLQAVTAVAAVAAVVVVLALTGPRLADLAAAGAAQVFDRLTPTDITLFWAGVIVVAGLPALVGAFWGAPLVAQELERGTHRLAWTQSVTRTRWLTTKLVVTAVAAALAVGAVAVAVSLWSAPLDGVVGSTRGSLPGHLTPVSFAMRGVVPVAYAVFAVVLGATLGAVLRRPIPAMALTLALYVVVQVVVPLGVRPHLVAPITATVTINADTLDGIAADPSGRLDSITVHTGDRDDWILSNETLDRTGLVATLPTWLADCVAPPTTTAVNGGVRATPIDPCLARLTAEGYTQRVVYQPADRFWPIQWAEAALYLAASCLLAGFCVWWTRKRLS